MYTTSNISSRLYPSINTICIILQAKYNQEYLSAHRLFIVELDTLVIYVLSVHTTKALGISSETLTTLPCFCEAFRKSAVMRLTEHSSISKIPITSSFFTVVSFPRYKNTGCHPSVNTPFSACQHFPPCSAERSSILQQVINT